MQLYDKKNARLGVAFLLMMGFGLGILLLVNFGTGGTRESVLIFAVIGIFSALGAIIAKAAGYSPFQWLDGKFDRSDLMWIGIGIVGLFGAVLGMTALIPGTLGIVGALMAGGVVLVVVLIKSQNFLANVAVHAAYNVSIVLASQGFFAAVGLSAIPLSSSPLFVPSFSFEGITPDDVLGQIMLQVFAVSASEELLKIAMSIAVSLFTTSRYIFFGVSTSAWSLMHLILAVR